MAGLNEAGTQLVKETFTLRRSEIDYDRKATRVYLKKYKTRMAKMMHEQNEWTSGLAKEAVRAVESYMDKHVSYLV